MKHQLRSIIEHALRRLPVSRAAYAQQDLLQAKVEALEVSSRVAYAQQDVLQAKVEALEASLAKSAPPLSPLDLLANSQCLSARGGLFALTQDCALGRAGDTILLPFDQAIFPLVVADSGWSLDTLEFLEQRIDPAKTYVTVDIGANVGLYTRQIAFRFPNLRRCLCIEAEPGNFRALQYNVASLLGDRAILWNVALSDSDGEVPFFRDDTNFGNYSLNNHAIRGQPFDTITVQSVATDRWMREHIRLEPDDRLVWKSDTQGYDELIISLTPLDIWDRVDVAIVELWRIKKPFFDQADFCRRIEAFPYKAIRRIEANKPIGTGNRNTAAEILEYLNGDDYGYADLYLWR
jgi:FkbM family methyltransferase